MTETERERRAARRYRIEFGAAMAAYVLTVVVSASWLRSQPGSAWRVPVALLPVVPILLAVWGLIRLYLRQDELKRRMQVESLAFAFVGTAFFVITYGFLEAAGFARLTVWWVWMVMAVLWLAGHGIAAVRYR